MKMTFGKNKGKEIKEISKSYLTWLLTLDNLQEDLREEIEKVLNTKEEVEVVEVEVVAAAETVLTFGQYKGLRIAEIENFNSQYLDFLVSKENYMASKIEEARQEIEDLRVEKKESEKKVLAEFLENEKIQFIVENDKIVFNVPFLAKSEFRSHFKTNSSFDRRTRKWFIANNTRNLNKVNKVGIFVEVEKFEDYSTNMNIEKKSFLRAGFPPLDFGEEFINDWSEDMDIFNIHTARKELERRAIDSFLNNIK